MQETKDKYTASNDFVKMIVDSWTYARLTNTERDSLIEAINRAHLIGTWKQRWEQLNDIYFAFLSALGYDKDPVGWRETDPEAPLW